MIGSPRSKYMNLLVWLLEVAKCIGHRESMMDTVEVGRNCLCLGGMYTLSPQSFYLGYPDRS